MNTPAVVMSIVVILLIVLIVIWKFFQSMKFWIIPVVLIFALSCYVLVADDDFYGKIRGWVGSLRLAGSSSLTPTIDLSGMKTQFSLPPAGSA